MLSQKCRLARQDLATGVATRIVSAVQLGTLIRRQLDLFVACPDLVQLPVTARTNLRIRVV